MSTVKCAAYNSRTYWLAIQKMPYSLGFSKPDTNLLFTSLSSPLSVSGSIESIGTLRRYGMIPGAGIDHRLIRVHWACGLLTARNKPPWCSTFRSPLLKVINAPQYDSVLPNTKSDYLVSLFGYFKGEIVMRPAVTACMTKTTAGQK